MKATARLVLRTGGFDSLTSRFIASQPQIAKDLLEFMTLASACHAAAKQLPMDATRVLGYGLATLNSAEPAV